MKRIVTLLFLFLVGCSSRRAQTDLPTIHTVQRGESLAGIVIQYYGEENKTAGIIAIIEANPQINNNREMQPLIITIPELDNN